MAAGPDLSRALAVTAGAGLSRSRTSRWEEPAAVYGQLPWEEHPPEPPRAWPTSSSVPPPS